MTREYGKWIGSMDWRYFITIRKNYKFHRNSVRRTIDKLGKSIETNKNIKSVFIVGERNIDDWDDHHLHLLIDTTDTDSNIQDYISSVSTKKDKVVMEEVIDKQSVSIYLSKYINRDIEYDFFNN
jgi:hypothetical protein